MSRFAIRRACAEDAAQIWRVHQSSIRQLCAAEYGEDEIDSWVGDRRPDHFRWAMVEGGEVMFVATVGDVVVGFSSFRGGEIRAVYVAPGWERRGIGGRLYTAAEEYARSLAIPKLRLHATLTARDFYRTVGFEEVEETEYRLVDGTRLACVLMEKEIE